MLDRNEYGLRADPVHEDAGAGLRVVQVDVPKLCYHVDNVELPGDLGVHWEFHTTHWLLTHISHIPIYLHCNWEVLLRLWVEVHIHCFLRERLVPLRRGTHLDDVQLAARGSPDCKHEQTGLVWVLSGFELSEGGGVSLQRLAHLPNCCSVETVSPQSAPAYSSALGCDNTFDTKNRLYLSVHGVELH